MADNNDVRPTPSPGPSPRKEKPKTPKAQSGKRKASFDDLLGKASTSAKGIMLTQDKPVKAESQHVAADPNTRKQLPRVGTGVNRRQDPNDKRVQDYYTQQRLDAQARGDQGMVDQIYAKEGVMQEDRPNVLQNPIAHAGREVGNWGSDIGNSITHNPMGMLKQLAIDVAALKAGNLASTGLARGAAMIDKGAASLGQKTAQAVGRWGGRVNKSTGGAVNEAEQQAAHVEQGATTEVQPQGQGPSFNSTRRYDAQRDAHWQRQREAAGVDSPPAPQARPMEAPPQAAPEPAPQPERATVSGEAKRKYVRKKADEAAAETKKKRDAETVAANKKKEEAAAAAPKRGRGRPRKATPAVDSDEGLSDVDLFHKYGDNGPGAAAYKRIEARIKAKDHSDVEEMQKRSMPPDSKGRRQMKPWKPGHKYKMGHEDIEAEPVPDDAPGSAPVHQARPRGRGAGAARANP